MLLPYPGPRSVTRLTQPGKTTCDVCHRNVKTWQYVSTRNLDVITIPWTAGRYTAYATRQNYLRCLSQKCESNRSTLDAVARRTCWVQSVCLSDYPSEYFFSKTTPGILSYTWYEYCAPDVAGCLSLLSILVLFTCNSGRIQLRFSEVDQRTRMCAICGERI